MNRIIYQYLFEPKKYYYFDGQENLRVVQLGLVQSILRRYLCCFYSYTKTLSVTDLQQKIFRVVIEQEGNVDQIYWQAIHYFCHKFKDSPLQGIFQEAQSSGESKEECFEEATSSTPIDRFPSPDPFLLVGQNNESIARFYEETQEITLYTREIKNLEEFCRFLRKSLETKENQEIAISSFDSPSPIDLTKIIPTKTLDRFGIKIVQGTTKIKLSRKNRDQIQKENELKELFYHTSKEKKVISSWIEYMPKNFALVTKELLEEWNQEAFVFSQNNQVPIQEFIRRFNRFLKEL